MTGRLIAGLACMTLLGALLGGCPKPVSETTTPPGPAQPAPETKVVVRAFIPCGLIVPMRETVTAYQELHPDVKIEQEYDNAITLARRIIDKGERPELFISPGATEMALLEEEGFVDPATKRTIGRFRLVVYAPRDSDVIIEKPEDLLQVGAISCPDPEVNSVGAHAKQALIDLGLWDQLELKVVATDFPIESHKFVASGKSDAGLGYKHCPLDTAPEKLSKSKVRIAFEFPPGSFAPPEAIIALLNDAAERDQALAFVDYLTSEEGQKVLADNGMPGAGEALVTAPEEESSPDAGEPAAPAPQ